MASAKRVTSEFSGTQRFALEGRLGEGGMGVVYRCRDRETGAVVALKTMTHLEPAGLLRFKNEFRALADIVHPNVVQLYELVSDGSLWFFTMELIEGVDFVTHVQDVDRELISGAITREGRTASWATSAATLDATSLADAASPPTKVSARRPLAWLCNVERLRPALRQLALGAAAIHAAGKLHRDLKPSNVMVTREGRVVLLDFGVVAELGPRGHGRIEEHIFGTPAYMAPEQAVGVGVKPAADWYAIGVMAYEALTGQLPFDGSAQDVLVAKQSSLPAPPSQLASGVPQDLDELVMRLLQPDPDDRPGYREILSRLESGTTKTPSLITTSSQAKFVGRERELGQLSAAYDAAAGGAATLALLSGPSGMGKSALAQRFLSGIADEQGVVTLAGRCFEREALPYKGMDSVIDELSRFLMRSRPRDVERWVPRGVEALARVFPVLRGVRAIDKAPSGFVDLQEPIEIRRRAFAALRQLLGAISEDYPLVVHIDDVQWSDVDTTSLLEELLRSPEAPPVLWLCTFREEARGTSQAVEALFRLGKRATSFSEIRLGELSDVDAQELCREALGQSSDIEAVSAIVDEAKGMPFFLAELVQRERERRSSGESEQPMRRGLALEAMITERIAGLPDDARALLEVLAVAGRPLAYGTAEAIALGSGRASPDGVAAARSQLRAARLVRSYRGGADELAEPYHAKIRESALGRLGTSERRDWHGSIATVLESREADAEALVEHYLAAEKPADARRFVLRAADSASSSLAFLRAARLYQLALELRADAPRGLVLRKRADALVSAGRGSDGADAYLEAAREPSSDAVDLRRLAAEHYLKCGRDVRGLLVLKDVLGDVGLSYPESPLGAVGTLLWNRGRLRYRPLSFRERGADACSPAELARVDVAFSATAGLSMIDVVRGASFGAQHLLLALEVGEPRRLCRALAYEAGNVAAAGGSSRDRVERMVRTAEDLAARSGDPAGLAMARVAAGMVRVFSGEWRSSQRVLEEAETILREKCRGVTFELTNTLAWICNALILCGELKQAATRVPQILQEARERDDRYALMHMTYPACITRLAAGDVEGAWAIASDDAPFKALEGTQFTGGHWGALISSISVHRYQGAGERAWRHLLEQWPRLSGSQYLRVELMRVFSWFERGLTALSAAESASFASRGELLAEADRCAERLAKERPGYAAAMRAHIAGCAAALRGARQEAVAELGSAHRGLLAADMGYLAACAAARLGGLLGGTEGKDLREECRAMFERQGVIDHERCLMMSAPGFGPPLTGQSSSVRGAA
ncbi:MAG TPA: AAA family ATPase [Polyangiaceae bacterium]|nr:AAA family ATPase [Polyangiaceae bacterium]